MRLRGIKIKGWRSVRELAFRTGGVTALVGANNAGKTGILSALNFLMGPKWPSHQNLEETDFYGRTRRKGMRIQVWFETDGEMPYSAWYEVASENAGETGGKVQFARDSAPYRMTYDMRDKFPMIYIDAERSYEKQFGASRWTLFGQAIRRLEEHFETQIGEDAKTQLGHHLDEAQKVLRTNLYATFVKAVGDAFQQQMQHTRHSVAVEFKAFDPLHFYRSLQPFLTEDGERKNASEAGSGLRNMIVLALFRAYGQTFKGDGVIAVEEPEMYLHPHAQRGLMRMFREMAENGTQILYSTHSSAFVDIQNFDEVVLVERCPDEFDEELCTTIRTLPAERLVELHVRNRPGEDFRIEGIRERYRHACGAEHTEALFGRGIVLVEGATETACLPMYADALGMNLDGIGVSIVNARGKDNLESLHHVYSGLGFPVFVVFDNDVGKPSGGTKDTERRHVANKRLTRLLGLTENPNPEHEVGPRHAIMARDFETVLRYETDAAYPGLFARLTSEAATLYGSDSKPIAARYIAEHLCKMDFVPPTVTRLLGEVAAMVERPLT